MITRLIVAVFRQTIHPYPEYYLFLKNLNFFLHFATRYIILNHVESKPFYNPLLIIYTPLKRPMAPPSVFYFSILFFAYSFSLLIKFTSRITTRTGITIGITNERIPPITATTINTIPITPSIRSSFCHQLPIV